MKIIKKEVGKENKPDDGADSEKSHPWRLCPTGEHWVTDHPLSVPPTDERPGYQTTRDGHCAVNPARGKSKTIQDYLTVEEMQWLFRKRDLASHRLRRQATWREAVAEYKAYLPDILSGKNPNPRPMTDIDKLYKRLKK